VLSCPWCKSKKGGVFATRKDDVEIKKCGRCGLLYAGKAPEDISEFYKKEYFEKEESAQSEMGYMSYTRAGLQNTIWQATIVSLLSQPGSSLLDVGCATGDFIEVMGFMGWKTEGIELSTWASAVARNRNLKVSNDPIEKLNRSQRFEIITAWELIEHVQNLKKTLLQIKKHLGPKGIFLFSTPLVENYNLSIEHLYFFEKKWLEINLSRFFKRKVIIFGPTKHLTTRVGIVLPKSWPGTTMLKPKFFEKLLELETIIGIAANQYTQDRLATQLNELKKSPQEWKKQIESLIVEKEGLIKQISEIKRSLSWKITGPMRKIGAYAKKPHRNKKKKA